VRTRLLTPCSHFRLQVPARDAARGLLGGKVVSPSIRLALALLVSTLAACGGKASKAGDDGTGATGSGGSGASGSGAGGTGQTGGSGTGGDAVCASYDDDYATSVQVSIANQTTTTLYLGQDMVTCSMAPLFQVANADGTPLPGLGNCRTSCMNLRQQGIGGCIGICAFPNTVQLQPGESLFTTWDGLFAVQGQLPPRCVPADARSEAMMLCDQAKRVEPGTFTFSALAGSALDCSQTNPDGACVPCAPSPNGGCTRSSSLIAGPLHAAEATVTLDASYGVYPAPSPTPDPGTDGAGAAPSDVPVARVVELVFSE
jgi:hypothetical protein